jgi:shikimate kinase
MYTDIILIGPQGCGKSTIGELLSRKLGLPQCSMDKLRWDYYKEIGYDQEKANELLDTHGFYELYKYQKPFDAYAVERLLAKRNGCVIDFGSGHSIYEDDELFRRVKKAMEPYKNVVLLLPSPDPDESVKILDDKFGEDKSGGMDFHEHFVKHHSNYDLAKIIVYIKNKTPQQTCEEILQKITV